MDRKITGISLLDKTVRRILPAVFAIFIFAGCSPNMDPGKWVDEQLAGSRTRRTSADISGFYIYDYGLDQPALIGSGVIDEAATPPKINVTVPAGTDISSLLPRLTITGRSYETAAEDPQDFSGSGSNPLVYTVYAQNGGSKTYAVTVRAGAGSDSNDTGKPAPPEVPTAPEEGTDTGDLADAEDPDDSVDADKVAKLTNTDNSVNYYTTLEDAISAAVATNSASPEVITILQDITIGSIVTINKHITITVKANKTKTISRDSGYLGGLFKVDDDASLTLGNGGAAGNLIIDGGAVWTGADTAADATGNTGITATASLITVLEKGTLKINNGTILQNNETSGEQYRGGGAIDNNGTVLISGGKIKNNRTKESQNDGLYGGGIYNTGSITMTGGEISGNYAAGSTGGRGGGIINNGTLTIVSGTISGNRAENLGGGITSEHQSARLDISGGTISGNTVAAGGKGNGIYIDDITATDAFKMSGAASIASDNDVYLGSKQEGQTAQTIAIAIVGSLSAGSAATITPNVYTAKTSVLSGTDILISSNCNKFTVTPQPTDSAVWYVDAEGKLAQQP